MSADTIYALSSGAGMAGVAVIRLSGPAAGTTLAALCGPLPGPRRAVLRTVRDPASGEAIDRGLVLWFPAPSSFTGEDMAELQVHGSRAVIADLFDLLARRDGLRLAEPGEFTRRAWHNGRMDLTAAEGLADLIAADTTAQRRQALRQADGELASIYAGWRERLLRVLAHMEAWLDFPDEDLPPETRSGLVADLVSLRDDVAAHLSDARRGERLRDGYTVAIVGPPNAGKSSLLNALARRDVAIVAATPGTTRDVLEVHLDLDGWPLVLLDTAGLRETDDAVEREGTRRALDRATRADLVLELRPADASASHPGPTLPDSVDRLLVRSKSDLPVTQDDPYLVSSDVITLSVLTGEGLETLLRTLAGRAAEAMQSGGNVLPTRLRHREGLAQCLAVIDRALALPDDGPPELMAEDLRMALRTLGRITGTVDVEDLLDVIFRDFCIGK
ncbi:MAG: tRNA uridine-5-carboxymethylaminomethyl(34) synthesis GTPase MnmE [Pseudomonadota bacterium]|nr:tRNA uridine-5-carboxymethylaminomethyl(34) synthesis GTPase MnmE [Pseudomonadota bacterium]